MNLVISRLSGGLGNQLFQFAAGKSLALRTNSRLVLDTSLFTLPTQKRKFALQNFQIDARVLDAGFSSLPSGSKAIFPRPRLFQWCASLPRVPHNRSIDAIKVAESVARRALAKSGRGVENALSYIGHKAGWSASFTVYREKAFEYDSAFETLGSQTYLVGYWQSFRYFVDIGDTIIRETRPLIQLNARNLEWIQKIKRCNSVCVHVRRGDYLIPGIHDRFGLRSITYYKRAIDKIKSMVATPKFFLFSNDLDWCRANLLGEDIVFVDANGEDEADCELHLMSSCRHHIIANSSLSWWAAWLGYHEEQIVIAPTPWLNIRGETTDLFPSRWLLMSR